MTLQSDLAGWLIARRGKLTASVMEKAVARTKTGWSDSRYKLMRELVAERAHDWAVNHYVSPSMRRGLEFEADARNAYEAYTGLLVTPAALVDHPAIDLLAATPDGFIAHDGLLEIKVPEPHNFVAWKIAGVIPTEHKNQMLVQLACTRRVWDDFCAYCPETEALFIRRFTPTAAEIQEIEKQAVEFLAETEKMFEQYINMPIAA